MSINNRDFTRFNFDPKMWVKVLRPDQGPEDFKMYRLVDISKGGLSFVINNVREFRRHDVFYILEVEGRVLETPIRAKVKYVKGMDEFGVDFKVGTEFIKKTLRKAS